MSKQKTPNHSNIQIILFALCAKPTLFHMGNGSITLPNFIAFIIWQQHLLKVSYLRDVIIGPQASPPYVVQFIAIKFDNDNDNKKTAN